MSDTETVIISGASGLVGQYLVNFLIEHGYKVYKLVRTDELHENEIFWDPKEKRANRSKFFGVSATIFINLSGENVAGLWTNWKKQEIYHSRIEATQFFAQLIQENIEYLQELAASSPSSSPSSSSTTPPTTTSSFEQATTLKFPRLFLSASAVGWYGLHREDEVLTESTSGPMTGSEVGTGFFHELCRDWEESALRLHERVRSVRVCTLRISLVLSKEGGMLKVLWPIWWLGLGGKVGDGKAWMPWISLVDLANAVHFLIYHEEISGPVNICSPNPVTNQEFGQTLASVMWRPCLTWIPGVVSEWFLPNGQGIEMFSSKRQIPEKLQQFHFTFQHQHLFSFLNYELYQS